MTARLFTLKRDARGAALMEFALVLPIALILILGGIEIGHTFYVKSVLVGKLQKAARDLSLEGAASDSAITAIQNEVTSGVKQVMSDARVTYDLCSFHDYKNAANRPEEFGDTDHDGVCNHGETYVDSNGNGQWDADGSREGRGGAKDVVMLTATVTYARFGMARLFSSNPDVKLVASTLLRNQPSTTQSEPSTRTCP